MDKNLLQDFLLQKKVQLELDLKKMEEALMVDTGKEIELMAAAVYEDERNNKVLVIKKSLEEMLSKVNKSLKKLKNDTYGICDRCRKTIDSERLRAIPTTNFCISCINL